ncbi:MAG TPA: hypothetical protein VNI02_01740 [Blastocatellia bacterium]|nr:hypothetical protein [Blastocatellia bacterium]
MPLVPFIELGFGVVNLVNAIRKSNKLKKEIKAIKQRIDETKKSLTNVRSKARSAGLDLGTANEHSKLADKVYNGLHTALLTLQAATPESNVTKVKNALLSVQKSSLTALLNEDTSVMQSSQSKIELESAKKALDKHFTAITEADNRNVLLKSVQLAIQDCIVISGARNAFFSRLGNELANV